MTRSIDAVFQIGCKIVYSFNSTLEWLFSRKNGKGNLVKIILMFSFFLKIIFQTKNCGSVKIFTKVFVILYPYRNNLLKFEYLKNRCFVEVGKNKQSALTAGSLKMSERTMVHKKKTRFFYNSDLSRETFLDGMIFKLLSFLCLF